MSSIFLKHFLRPHRNSNLRFGGWFGNCLIGQLLRRPVLGTLDRLDTLDSGVGVCTAIGDFAVLHGDILVVYGLGHLLAHLIGRVLVVLDGGSILSVPLGETLTSSDDIGGVTGLAHLVVRVLGIDPHRRELLLVLRRHRHAYLLGLGEAAEVSRISISDRICEGADIGDLEFRPHVDIGVAGFRVRHVTVGVEVVLVEVDVGSSRFEHLLDVADVA
jgi:hypothetical protein